MYYRDEDKNRTGDLDYFAGFLNKLTHQDADDLEFYEKPPVLSPRIFTMEDKLAYAFDLYDVNGDGNLDLDEIVEIVNGIIEMFYDTSSSSSLSAWQKKRPVELGKDVLKSVKVTEIVTKSKKTEDKIFF